MDLLANLVNFIPASVGGEISFVDKGRVQVEAHLDNVSWDVNDTIDQRNGFVFCDHGRQSTSYSTTSQSKSNAKKSQSSIATSFKQASRE
jgi:hypothetical protein